MSEQEATPDAELLIRGTAAQKRKALRGIRTRKDSGSCSALVRAYHDAMRDRRQWELQARILFAFGECLCRSARPLLLEAIDRSDLYPALRSAARQSLLMLEADSGALESLLREYLDDGRIEAVGAVTGALATGIRVPESLQQELIERVRALPEHPNHSHPMYGLLRAVATWNTPSAQACLQRCAESEDALISRLAREILQGKYKYVPPLL